MALLGPGQGAELCEVTRVKTKLLECFRICKALSPALTHLLFIIKLFTVIYRKLLYVELSSR